MSCRLQRLSCRDSILAVKRLLDLPAAHLELCYYYNACSSMWQRCHYGRAGLYGAARHRVQAAGHPMLKLRQHPAGKEQSDLPAARLRLCSYKVCSSMWDR